MKKYVLIALFAANCVFANDTQTHHLKDIKSDNLEGLKKLQKSLVNSYRKDFLLTFFNLYKFNGHFQKKNELNTNNCSKKLFDAVRNGNMSGVKQIIQDGCPVNVFEKIQETKREIASRTYRESEKWLDANLVCTPLWAAIFECDKSECLEVANFIHSKGGKKNTAIKVKESVTTYLSEGHAIYEVGGKSQTLETGYRLLEN